MFLNISLVALGGAIGACGRYGLSLLTTKFFGAAFAWGTLIANLAGCFLIGLIFGLATRDIVSAPFKLFFVTGFLGGLTTFSSYAMETIGYLRDGFYLKAGMNFLANNLAGCAFAIIALALVSRKN